LLQLSGTFGGSTLGLSVTTNGVTTSYGAWTSVPSSVPCFNIPTSSIVQATLTGGTPSNITATLGGVGSGGCATGGGGGGGDASAANQTAVQANAGADAGKAVAVQGVTGGKPVAVSASTLSLPTGAATATNQSAANTALGAPADSACGTATGVCSLIALQKYQNAQAGTAIPAQSSSGVLIGAVEGGTASGVSPTENPLYDGCRAATQTPVAIADGLKVGAMCGALGQRVMVPFTVQENWLRGANSTTGTSATIFTGMGAQGVSTKIYVTSVACFRTDAGSAASRVTLNDSASTTVALPVGGGSNLIFPIPLDVAVNTAFQFTPADALATVYCNATGYKGP
jgi:hypothetical protein